MAKEKRALRFEQKRKHEVKRKEREDRACKVYMMGFVFTDKEVCDVD